MKRTLLILLCCLCYAAYGQSLQANFYALGGTTPYYSMGWDSVEEANKWKYFTLNNTATWQLFEQPSWKAKGNSPVAPNNHQAQQHVQLLRLFQSWVVGLCQVETTYHRCRHKGNDRITGCFQVVARQCFRWP